MDSNATIKIEKRVKIKGNSRSKCHRNQKLDYIKRTVISKGVYNMNKRDKIYKDTLSRN